jgi:RNA polymerase sigma-70 factor (ECF subfamily)
MTELCRPQLRGIPVVEGAAGHQEGCPAGGPGHDAAAVVTRLYADNGAFVLSYVTGLLKDRYLAEDVVQETMLRAWHHCADFSAEKGSVRGWLIRVAHNIAMDKIRMRRSRPTEVAEDAMPEALIEQDHADAVVTALHVRHALARLSPGHRDVLEQVYLNGCTAREAAARLGIPEGTAFSRAYYALRILRRELGPSAAEEQHQAA